MDKKKESQIGITLVALVITIIIMLILAGITISLTIGQKGILNRAREAGKNYGEASNQEENELIKISDEMDNIIEDTVVSDSSSEPNYTIVDGVPVPKGFKHIEGTKDTGFVIKDISADSQGNPTQTNGNEFVWVPCTENGANQTIKYDRYAFAKEGWVNSQVKDAITGKISIKNKESFEEEESVIELSSIKTYGGFYIGRYEAGIEGGSLDISEMADEYTAPNREWTGYRDGMVVIQKGQQVWNYITRDKAKIIAEGIYNNDVVVSKLCSSYAWDTTLQFIETKNTGYATTNSKQSGLQKTGEANIEKNHIYDMEGNIGEWTTEYCNASGYPCTSRGGNYDNEVANNPAAYRDGGREDKCRRRL